MTGETCALPCLPLYSVRLQIIGKGSKILLFLDYLDPHPHMKKSSRKNPELEMVEETVYLYSSPEVPSSHSCFAVFKAQMERANKREDHSDYL